MHRTFKLMRPILVLSAFLCFFLSEVTVYGGTQGLKVQLVLEARNSRVSIPYQVADQVVDHLSQTIKETAFTSILRGDDKIILTFFSPLSCRNEIPQAISLIDNLPSGTFIKTGTWKHDETALPGEIVFEQGGFHRPEDVKTGQPTSNGIVNGSANTQGSQVYQGLTSYKKQYDRNHIKYIFEHASGNLFNVEAISVPLGMILDSMASASDFEYICPQSIGRKELSINCKSVSLESLLAALKLSFNLSIKRTGKIVTFVDG